MFSVFFLRNGIDNFDILLYTMYINQKEVYKMYFKYFKDAKKHAEKNYKNYSIWFCSERKMFYILGGLAK